MHSGGVDHPSSPITRYRMSTKIFPDLAEELPVTEIPREPHWSENYCYEGYDEANNIGFWLHLGRWPRNPAVWREQLWVYWPDGTYSIMRGFGAHPVDSGVGGALLKLTCLEPGEWRIQFDGPTRMTSSSRMATPAASYLSDGPYAAVSLDIRFSANHPAWNFGDVLRNENWSRFHYEQHGRVRGSFRLEPSGKPSKSFNVNCAGYRDHSRGPRELSTFGGNYWIHGQFPNGRAFSLMHVWKNEGGTHVPAFSQAVVFEGGKIYPAIFGDLPLLVDRYKPSREFQLTLESELGQMRVAAVIKRTVCQSADSYMDSFDGIARAEQGVLYVYEEPTQFTWNGIVGTGHSERAERA
jgi:hypothetical protein